MISRLAVVVGLGLSYGWLWQKTGIGLTCLIHKFTGFYCPGCGVTRMFLALMRLDWNGAIRSNCALCLLLPVGMSIGLKVGIRYIRLGRVSFDKKENILFYIIIVLLLLFGIIRNLPGFEMLRPH